MPFANITFAKMGQAYIPPVGGGQGPILLYTVPKAMQGVLRCVDVDVTNSGNPGPHFRLFICPAGVTPIFANSQYVLLEFAGVGPDFQFTYHFSLFQVLNAGDCIWAGVDNPNPLVDLTNVTCSGYEVT